MKIVWSPLASGHVDEAFSSIAADKPSVAIVWLERMLEQVSSLSALPDRGRVVPELARPEIRELLVGAYRVVYRREDDLVSVLAVVHGRMLLDVPGEDTGAE